MNGWIKLQRKFIEWEWYDDINTCRLFLHLLLTCNHETKKWHGVEVKRGELITGRKVLAKQTRLTQQQIRSSLNKLKSTNEITTKSTNKFTVISICRFDFYQKNTTSKSTNNPHNEQPTNNQQVTTTKEGKNIRNNKKKEEGVYTPAQKMKSFLNAVKEKNADYFSLVSLLEQKTKLGIDKITTELDKFTSYWTELNKSGSKQRWETEKTFEVQKRLTTWFGNIRSFSGSNKQKVGATIST